MPTASRFTVFTPDEVRAINDAVMARRDPGEGLCPANAERVRRTHFSRDEINAAFAVARARLACDG